MKINKSIRVIVYVFVGLVINTSAFGQTYFSKVYNFDLPSVVFTNLLVEDDSLLIVGTIYDTIAPIRSSIVLKSDLEGNASQVYRFKHESQIFNAWRKNLNKLNDTTYLLGVERYYPSQAGIIAFNDQGEIQKSHYYESTYAPEETFIISDDILILDSLIYYSLKMGTTEPHSELMVYKYDMDLAPKDSLHIKLDNLGNLFAIEPSLDNQLFFGMYNLQTTYKGFTFENIIQKRDTNFNLLWEYKTPKDSLYSTVLTILPTQDSGLVVGTYAGREFYVNPGSNSYCMDDILVYKLDKHGDLLWETRIWDAYCHPVIKAVKGLKELKDGNILVAGSSYEPLRFKGTLIKLSAEGDSLWHRFYTDPTKTETIQHQINDMQVLDNGDILMCGESGGPQEGWLLRVDSMGCLIPNCHTAVEKIRPDHTAEIMVAPNPVRDQLIVHIAVERRHKEGEFQLINMQGQVVREWDNSMQEITHMIDVDDLPPGQYQLLYSFQGKVLTSHPVVKM